MAKRMTLMLIAVAVVVTALGTVKYRQVQAAIAQGKAYQPPPEAVTTVTTSEVRWDSTLSAIGSAAAVQGVMVAADLPGVVERIAFDSGSEVHRGDVLVKLDTRQEEAQLDAAKAQRDLARTHLARIQNLRDKGVTSQAELDDAKAQLAQADARVSEIHATIERKTIRAPFDGALGIRQVDLGQYLGGGDPVVPLQSLHPIYVNFSVPQQQVSRLSVGTQVSVTVEGSAQRADEAADPDPLTGKVTAIDSIVDASTRNVQVQATFDNAGEELRPGMFVEAQAHLGEGPQVIALPASAIAYAPYGDSVYVVGDMKGPDGKSYRGVRQQFVKLGASRGDQVAVLSGLEPGQDVVTSGVFKLRNGAAVLVNNEVQPGNDPSPNPTDS
jgi:membrane fusion protein (multidrug efflux system)